jgi:membrane protease YdiL (CAAX protease family)
MKLNRKRAFVTALVAVCTPAMAFFEYAGISFSEDKTVSEIIRMVITRGLGSLMFTALALYLGYRVFNPVKKPFLKSLLFALPCFLVVVNNLPIIALAAGDARLKYPAPTVLLFALECLFIGFFEEMAFRGSFFLLILETRRDTRKNIFFSTVISSAVFGGVHIFNLFAGSGIGPVLMQIGYSFLIGGMCAVVLLKTKNIWLCVMLHAVYDFCGFLIPTLGEGALWDTPTVIITAVLAFAVAAHVIYSLFRIRPEDLDGIYAAGKN